MTAPDPSWTGRRWGSVLAVMILSHLGIFWLLARAPSAPSITPAASALVARWAEATPDPYAGGLASPTRFALPGSGGFSADADNGLPQIEYGLAIPKAAPKFLPANPDAGHLGKVPHTAKPDTRAIIRIPDATAGMLIEPVAADRGVVEIGGLPAGTVPRREIRVPRWTDPVTPQPTRIEFAVNPLGEVVTARLTLASGSRTADLAALAAIRDARFTMRPDAVATDAFVADRLMWGIATFHPIATNAPVAAPQAR